MQYYFFFGGFCSQWYPAHFVLDKVEYSCTEQYMMRHKALMFSDRFAAKRIMAAKSPWDMKALGRKVRGFNVDQWNEQARDIIYRANVAKFQQNPKLLKMLNDTKPAMIVEASPTDQLWGIGLGELDSRRNDPSKWRGVNWLGEVLMAVRDGKPAEWSNTLHTYKKMPPL